MSSFAPKESGGDRDHEVSGSATGRDAARRDRATALPDGSPRAAAQRKVCAGIQESSRMVAQQRMVDAVIQRTLKTPNGGNLNPAGANAWAGLTTAQKAFARRLMNDPYSEYRFHSTADFISYIQDPNGATQPVAVVTLGQRRQDALPSDPGDPLFGAYSASGRGTSTPGTTTHKSNWAHYVMGQFTAARQYIDANVPLYGAALFATTAIEALRDEALQLADRLDSQQVDTATPLANLPVTPGHPLGLVEPPVHHVDVQNVTKWTAGQWIHELRSGPAYDYASQQWQWRSDWQWRYEAPQSYSEQTSTNVYGQELNLELAEPRLLQQRLVDMWAEVANASGQDPRQFPQAAVPRWGAMKTDGIGTWVIAEYTPDSSWAVGSDSDVASAPSPWNIGNLGRRMTMNRAGRYYIQGHLLNDNMGGPGLAYNMTPLSGEVSASSINANQGHLHVVEAQAKAALGEMVADRDPSASPRPNPIASMRYAVIGSWRGHGQRTTVAARAAQAVAQIQNIKTYLTAAGVASPGTLTIHQLHQGLINNTWALPGGTTSFLWTDPTAGIKSFVDAVVPAADRGGKTVDAATALMADNAALWAYENANVPSHIDFRLTTVRRNGDADNRSGDFENRITTDPAQPFG